ncbi:unnamed protein product [Rotaria sordida]|uniref:RING-type domain-containing protein n=1 Tax=Rotaria sordida TaxID=392033 RepID=A0A814Y952_9BILA|nr:unnamed protein product [Rotaria sordida]
MMYRTTLNNRINALANNYIYINQDEISHSLICPICLDPLIDPQTHVLCNNSFCNRCIRKLRYCPCCRATIMELNDLIVTSDIIRNTLDELQIQCNICKHILCRGDFDNHIRNDCLQLSLITSEEENNSNTNEKYLEKHLSNLYCRIRKLEDGLYESKKVILTFLFVLSIIGIIILLNTILLYIIHLTISGLFTIKLPLFIQAIQKFLFDFLQ